MKRKSSLASGLFGFVKVRASILIHHARLVHSQSIETFVFQFDASQQRGRYILPYKKCVIFHSRVV
jgi:hypothetical protein